MFFIWNTSMFKPYGKILASCLFLTLVGCQSTSSEGNAALVTNDHVGQLIISEPLAINFKKEIALARISDFLQSPEIKPEQRAKAFYDRGLLFDSFGLPSLARLDFNRALRIDPKMAEAYNFLGKHYTLIGQFEKAYEAFDATIELAPKHQYVYLNRGISLYYGGHEKLAREDLQNFHRLDPSDPYRVIWRYLAEHKVDKTMAITNLKTNREQVNSTVWAREIIDLYLMNISEAQFVKGLTRNIASQEQLAERLCEAYFYLGKFARSYGQFERAENYFKLSLATNVFEFVEHRYARRELLETRLQMHKRRLDKAAASKLQQ